MSRMTSIKRKTKETEIELSLEIDGEGIYDIDTGCGFFDHMLAQVARHGCFDINLKAKGDLEIDAHHTVEDVGIVLGKALANCLGEKTGINRYGSIILPMDEALCMVSLDICGRPNLIFNGEINGVLGTMDGELVHDFFKAFVDNSMVALHINILYGRNNHHRTEGVFKAFGRVLREAVRIDNIDEIPTTKGCL